MTLNLGWIVSAGVLAVSLVLAAVAWLRLRGRDGSIGDPAEAADAADAALAGFRTVAAVVGIDGGAALVVDAADRVAVCRRVGKRVAAREVGWSAIRAATEGLLVDADGRCVLVAGVDALDVRRLRPQEARNPASASAM